MEGRRSRGRQRIEMVKMENENNLQVTFSKRRAGLFKKASELCTLCGAEVLIIVFSPGNKVFSFGHPSVEGILDRYLMQNPPPAAGGAQGASHLVEAHRSACVRELNIELTHVETRIDDEKKRTDCLDHAIAIRGSQFWWESPYEKLNVDQLKTLKKSIENLHETVQTEVNRAMAQAAQEAGSEYLGAINGGGTGVYGRGRGIPFSVGQAIVPPGLAAGQIPFDDAAVRGSSPPGGYFPAGNNHQMAFGGGSSSGGSYLGPSGSTSQFPLGGRGIGSGGMGSYHPDAAGPSSSASAYDPAMPGPSGFSNSAGFGHGYGHGGF